MENPFNHSSNIFPEIRLISIDLFRTLVKVDENREFIWRTFLGDQYEDETARKYFDRSSEILFHNLDKAASQLDPFKKVRDIFIESYAELFEEINLPYDPRSATETMFQGHRLDHLFEDSLPFLQAAGRRYPICLSTDCDSDMLDGVRNIYSFDKLFVSEELGAYKAHPLFFTQVLQHYRLNPENILHIGDGRADVLTPKKLGIRTCWLNRYGDQWKPEVKPDFEVKSLLDILEILGI